MTIPETMVERVAKAIDPKAFDERRTMGQNFRRIQARDKARAAINAMRMPTAEMAQLGFEAIMSLDLACREDPLHVVEIQTTAGKDAWIRMIDAALTSGDTND